jgi:hypothetical protein
MAKTLRSALPGEGEPFCAGFLHRYLNLPEERIREMFVVVSDYYSFDGNDIEGMAHKFITSLERRHKIVGCNQGFLVELIGKAVEIVDPLFDDFMAETTAEIKAALYKLTGKVLPSA